MLAGTHSTHQQITIQLSKLIRLALKMLMNHLKLASAIIICVSAVKTLQSAFNLLFFHQINYINKSIDSGNLKHLNSLKLLIKYFYDSLHETFYRQIKVTPNESILFDTIV